MGCLGERTKEGGKRLYIGTHLTDNLAARCQDRALLKLEKDGMKPIKLNFNREDYDEDEHLRNTLNRVDFLGLLRAESRGSYSRAKETECLLKLLAEEEAKGNLPISSKNKITPGSSETRRRLLNTGLSGSTVESDHQSETNEEDPSCDDSSDVELDEVKGDRTLGGQKSHQAVANATAIVSSSVSQLALDAGPIEVITWTGVQRSRSKRFHVECTKKFNELAVEAPKDLPSLDECRQDNLFTAEDAARVLMKLKDNS